MYGSIHTSCSDCLAVNCPHRINMTSNVYHCSSLTCKVRQTQISVAEVSTTTEYYKENQTATDRTISNG